MKKFAIEIKVSNNTVVRMEVDVENAEEATKFADYALSVIMHSKISKIYEIK